jgi:tetrahydromethanopterin S-methyltransferase subunit H
LEGNGRLKVFRFEREQAVVNIAGVKLGGQPGEFPTVLAGTIFYQGHKIVQDEDVGLFDRTKAEKLVVRQAELSEETGNPALLHVYARTTKAFERYLVFVEEVWSGPFIIDSADQGVRAAAAGLVSELGYADKAIYNSISLATNSSEEQAIRDSEIDSAILLAYNPAEPGVDGSIKVLETGATVREMGLIPLARDLGIVNLLIDPGVVPMGSGAGAALRFSVVAKAKYGLPVGSGIHNAVSSWPWLKGKSLQDRRCCDAAATAMQQLSGGDYVLYGPIENADFIFPVAATADIMVSEAVRDLDTWPAAGHPINRII